MANNCCFNMKVVGDRIEDINEFYQILTYSHPEGRYFARIFEAYEYEEGEENGKPYMKIAGDCAWSVYSCMCGGVFTYYNDNTKKDSKISNLQRETKRLGLKVEIYSQEPGVGFAEHIIYDNGEEALSDETDYEECWVDGDYTIEDFEEEHGYTFSDEELDFATENGYVTFGGYEEVFTI